MIESLMEILETVLPPIEISESYSLLLQLRSYKHMGHIVCGGLIGFPSDWITSALF